MFSEKLKSLVAAQKPQDQAISLEEVVRLTEGARLEVIGSGKLEPSMFIREGHMALVAWGEETTKAQAITEGRHFGPLRWEAEVLRQVPWRDYQYISFNPQKGLGVTWFVRLEEGKIYFKPYLAHEGSSGSSANINRDIDGEFLAALGITGSLDLDIGEESIIELPRPMWVSDARCDCWASGQEVETTYCLQSEVAELIGDFRQQLDELLK